MNKSDLIMSSEEMNTFLNQIGRYEFAENPYIYSKAIRVSLIALGYDEEWVNGVFRDRLEKVYDHFFHAFWLERFICPYNP